MEFYNDDINNIYGWEFVCDRIDIEGGRGSLIGAKVAPYGVATIVIFVYGEGCEGIGIWWYLYVIYIWGICVYLYCLNMIILLRRRRLCS